MRVIKILCRFKANLYLHNNNVSSIQQTTFFMYIKTMFNDSIFNEYCIKNEINENKKPGYF